MKPTVTEVGPVSVGLGITDILHVCPLEQGLVSHCWPYIGALLASLVAVECSLSSAVVTCVSLRWKEVTNLSHGLAGDVQMLSGLSAIDSE